MDYIFEATDSDNVTVQVYAYEGNRFAVRYFDSDSGNVIGITIYTTLELAVQAATVKAVRAHWAFV